jgi:hypothetical protein
MDDQVRVSRRILDETQRFLRRQGMELREGIVLWITSAPRTAAETPITRVVVPEQDAPTILEGCYIIVPLAYRQRLTRELDAAGERIVAQVHSHPGEAFHSDVDDRYPVVHHQGAYSLVVPDFCKAAIDFETMAVFRLTNWPNWTELNPDNVRTTFKVGA